MGFLDFDFGSALDTAVDFTKDFIADVELEDIATIATTGMAISSFLDARDISKGTPSDTIVGAASALSQGAKIASFTAQPSVTLGGDDEDLQKNKAATKRNLRVKRTASNVGAGTGLQANPLGIRI